MRTAAAAGCTVAVLTNAAGCLRVGGAQTDDSPWAIGNPVLINDQLNLTGVSPLTGPLPPPPHDFRHVDLTDASPSLQGVGGGLVIDVWSQLEVGVAADVFVDDIVVGPAS